MARTARLDEPAIGADLAASLEPLKPSSSVPRPAEVNEARRRALLEAVSGPLVDGRLSLKDNASEAVIRLKRALACAWDNRAPGAAHVSEFMYRLLYNTAIRPDGRPSGQNANSMTIADAFMKAAKDSRSGNGDGNELFATASSSLEWRLNGRETYQTQDVILKEGFRPKDGFAILIGGGFGWPDFVSGMASIVAQVESKVEATQQARLAAGTEWEGVYAGTVKRIRGMHSEPQGREYSAVVAVMHGISFALVGADDPKKTKTPGKVYGFYAGFAQANADLLGRTLSNGDEPDGIMRTAEDIWKGLTNPNRAGDTGIHKGLREYMGRKRIELDGQELKLGAYNLFRVMLDVRKEMGQ